MKTSASQVRSDLRLAWPPQHLLLRAGQAPTPTSHPPPRRRVDHTSRAHRRARLPRPPGRPRDPSLHKRPP